MPQKQNQIKHSIILFIFLLMVLIDKSYSQEIPISKKRQYEFSSIKVLADYANNNIIIDYPFIIGKEHIPITNKTNHPYYNTNDWCNGTFVYDNKQYHEKNLKFDLENNKLIYLMYSKDYSLNTIELDENFIPEFTILNSSFRFFSSLKTNKGHKLKNGYYEVIYDGSLKFIIYWKKLESIDENSTSTKYKLSSNMYLLKGDSAYRIKNKSNLLKQLEDKKKEIKNLIHANSLIYNKANYFTADTILKFYESLPKQ